MTEQLEFETEKPREAGSEQKAPAEQRAATEQKDRAPVYLVDGSGYIFRAYFAIQPLSTSRGLPSNALLGFTRMLMKLLRDVEARYIAVAFDTGEKNFRHALYSDYKANREACPEDLVPQMPYFRKIVEAMGIRSVERIGFEADDVIATLALRLRELGEEVVIVSGDKDLTQLVQPGIRMWDAMKDVMYDEGKVKEKFGVEPKQMLDYLSLIGDSSDNVPGVRGIGPKSAQRLLEHFGSVEQILEKPEAIEGLTGLRGARSIREKIESSRDKLRLSRELIGLDTKVTPFEGIGGVQELAWGKPDPEILGPLFEELEFTSMLRDLEKREGFSASRSQPKKFVTVASAELPEFAARLAELPAFAFDTETSSLDVHSGQLLGISFSWLSHEAYYLPLCSELEPDSCLDPEEVRRLIGPIMSNRQIKKFGANLKFDVQALKSAGIEVEGVAFDTMICAHVLNPDRRDYGLKALSRLHLGEQMSDYGDVVGDCDHLGQVPLAQVSHYACMDAECSWRLAELLAQKLGPETESPSLRFLFENVEMPLVPVLADIEYAGVKVDTDYLAKLGEEFSAELRLLESEIHRLAGTEFNINSPKQLSVILFDNLQLSPKGVKKTQSGYSTNAAVLESLAGEHEIARQLLQYREVHKLNSTYVEALQRLCNPVTGRIHTSFNQAVAATGRLSSSDPNLQNIPIRNARGRRIRSAFIAEAGHQLISADYSQIELRILAHLSGDEKLREAFRSGEDIHQRTAREIFGGGLISTAEMKELRRIAKTINFGIIYGMGAFRLSKDLGVSRKQAQQYIDDYFARYPRVREYFKGLEESAERNGYVETMFGRRRYVSELDMTGRDAGYAVRSMANAPIQGTAAEIIKLAMIALHKRLAATDLAEEKGSARIVLQVHDELVIEAPESSIEQVGAIVVEEMERAVELSVPLKVDARWGRCWGETPL